MDIQEWLASLKPGDRVVVVNYFGGDTIEVVERRTPSGRIVLGPRRG